MPRALTAQEKSRQREKLLEVGKEIILTYGIRRFSVDEVAREARMAKGTFYLHFASKEQFLYKLFESIHRHVYSQAELLIKQADGTRDGFRAFVTACFKMPELVFLMNNERDIETLLMSVTDNEFEMFKHSETEMFARILDMVHIDMQTVKAGVVHNYVHLLYLMAGSYLMDKDCLPETLDRITDSLIDYVFGEP